MPPAREKTPQHLNSQPISWGFFLSTKYHFWVREASEQQRGSWRVAAGEGLLCKYPVGCAVVKRGYVDGNLGSDPKEPFCGYPNEFLCVHTCFAASAVSALGTCSS